MSDELLLDFDDDPTPQNLFDCPGPGIYKSSQVSFDTYLGWRAVNSGVVKWGLITPKHFAAAFDGRLKSEDTKDRRLGRAIHCRLLEPDSFDERYIVAGPCEAVIKSGKSKGRACGAPGKFLVDNYWLCGKHGDAPDGFDGKEVLTQDELRRTIGVANSLKTLPPEIRAMLSRPGWNEASLVWDYKGLKIKCRTDRYSEGRRPCIIDVKKMQVGAGVREQCQKAIARYRYDVQQALYRKGAESLTGVVPEFIWVFVEDNEPFDIQIIPASDEDLAVGWEACERSIRCYLDSKPDHWGYVRIPENIKPGGLPPWVIRDYQERFNV